MEIFTIATVWILTLCSLALGYWIGKHDQPIQEIQEQIKQIKKKNVEVGPVNRPPAETVNYRTNKKQEEEDDAFKESFLKDHPEMKEVYERQKS